MIPLWFNLSRVSSCRSQSLEYETPASKSLRCCIRHTECNVGSLHLSNIAHYYLRSKTENYFLALSVKTSDLKLARGEILSPLIDDLKQLEQGILTENGSILKAGVLFYLGDNLESCTVGGFSTNFSHGYVCRICHQLYSDLPDITGIPKASYWTKEEYDNSVKKTERAWAHVVWNN